MKLCDDLLLRYNYSFATRGLVMTAWDEVLFSPWRPHPSSVNHYDTIAQAPGPAPDPAPDSAPDPDPGPDRSRYSKVVILAERG